MIDWRWMKQALNEGLANALKYGVEWGVKFAIAVGCITAGVWVLIQAVK